MTADVPFVPPGYRMRRTLCERNGSWISLAMNPQGQFCCLKLQKIAHADSLDALADTRRILIQLTTGNAFIPLVAWGVDPPSGVLWEELQLADDVVTNRPFAPENADTYTPLTLAARVREGGALSTQSALDCGVALAKGIASLHQNNLFHRDVKPSNILVFNGQCVLGDYGSVGAAGSQIEFPGTEGYVPPDGLGSPAMDVFALGRTLYEAWTGLDRFQFPSLPPFITQADDWETHGWLLNRVLLNAADGRPSQRFSTAQQLADALVVAQQGRRRLSRRTVLGGVSAILAASTAAYIWKGLPSHRAVWKRITPGRFGYEHWRGTELSCDWKRRIFYSVNSDTRALVLQCVHLDTFKHNEWGHPTPRQGICRVALMSPDASELWAVESQSGKVHKIPVDGSGPTSLEVSGVEELDFTECVYFNPLTGALGQFAGYHNFRAQSRRREFSFPLRKWQEIPEVSTELPWPRTGDVDFPSIQFFPKADRKQWLLFGGAGNPTGTQFQKNAHLTGYNGSFYPINDFWELDLTTNCWRPILRPQQWIPNNLKAAIYHPELDSALFLCGSQKGEVQEARFYLSNLETGRLPQALPNSGDTIELFVFWSLLADPETQKVWVFANEGVFTVTLQPV